MRQPKPFFRKQTKSWYVQFGKRQINLGRSKEEAWTKYHELMSGDSDLNQHESTVAQLLDRYLDWCEKRRASGTYRNTKRFFKSFLECIGKRLKVRQLKPMHITKWMDLHPTWSANTQCTAISMVQRAFNWAVKQGHIDRTPIPHIEDKPARTRREVFYTADQFKQVLEAVTDDIFRNLLEFMWETGCRPAEARAIESRHVDLNRSMIVLEVSLNKSKKGQRVIFLTDRAIEIIQAQLATANNEAGPIFRNRRGNPWTKDSIKCRLQRIKVKLGMDRLCAYGIRHSYATEGLKNNVDPLSLSILMGHSDVAMIARTYQHLSKNPEFLLTQAKKATGTK